MQNITVTTTNEKGQLVIPKKERDELGITPNTLLSIQNTGSGILILPIKKLITGNMDDAAFEEVLKRTQGAWGERTPEEIATELEQERLEKQKIIELTKQW